MVCWCETSEKEKTKAIADAEAKDLDLVSEIEERSARHGVLSTEIEYTKGEIGEDKEAAAEAMKMREDEAAEFMGTEKEMVQAITNLKNAVMVLSKHQLLQLDSEVVASLGPVLRDVSEKHETMLGDREGSKKTRQALKAALISLGTDTRRQSSEDGTSMSLRRLRTALNPYAGSELLGEVPYKFAAQVLARRAQEGHAVTAFVQKGTQRGSQGSHAHGPTDQIFGILSQMKEEFETNLASAQKEEATAAEDYTGLKATKEEQLAASKAKVDAMLQEHADNKKALYDAKEDLVMTRDQRTEDVEFLKNLKVTCGDLDHQWELRSKMRTEEIKAVSETIGIVTDDDAKDLMSKTVTLLQTASQTATSQKMKMMRMSAAAVLRRAMEQPDFDDLLDAWHGRHAPAGDRPRAQLAMLTMSVQLDAFKKVIEAMDQMVAELKDQQKEEVKLKEFCTAEFSQNEK